MEYNIYKCNIMYMFHLYKITGLFVLSVNPRSYMKIKFFLYIQLILRINFYSESVLKHWLHNLQSPPAPFQAHQERTWHRPSFLWEAPENEGLPLSEESLCSNLYVLPQNVLWS